MVLDSSLCDLCTRPQESYKHMLKIRYPVGGTQKLGWAWVTWLWTWVLLQPIALLICSIHRSSWGPGFTFLASLWLLCQSWLFFIPWNLDAACRQASPVLLSWSPSWVEGSSTLENGGDGPQWQGLFLQEAWSTIKHSENCLPLLMFPVTCHMYLHRCLWDSFEILLRSL